MSLHQTEQLLKTVIDDEYRSNPENEISQLAGLLNELSVKFAKEDEPGVVAVSKITTESNGTKPFEKFTLFPALPVEIRRKIWGHALPGHQVIELYSTRPGNDILMPKHTHAALGSIMKVNVEAYQVVQEKYRMIDSWLLRIQSVPMESVFLLDHTKDILYLNGIMSTTGAIGFQTHSTWIEEAECFKSIAFNIHHFKYWLGKSDNLFKCKWLPQMKNLEKIYLVLQGDDDRHRGSPLELANYEKGQEKLEKEHPICKTVTNKWSEEISKHPEMRPLLDVLLVFVDAKRTNPPKLLSKKISHLSMKASLLNPTPSFVSTNNVQEIVP